MCSPRFLMYILFLFSHLYVDMGGAEGAVGTSEAAGPAIPTLRLGRSQVPFCRVLSIIPAWRWSAGWPIYGKWRKRQLRKRQLPFKEGQLLSNIIPIYFLLTYLHSQQTSLKMPMTVSPLDSERLRPPRGRCGFWRTSNTLGLRRDWGGGGKIGKFTKQNPKINSVGWQHEGW